MGAERHIHPAKIDLGTETPGNDHDAEAFADAYLVDTTPIASELPTYDLSEMEKQPADERVSPPYYQTKSEQVVTAVHQGVDAATTWVGEKVSTGANSIKEAALEQFEKVRGVLSKRNLDTFEGLSEHGKRIATSAYESVTFNTGIDRMTTKIGVMWHSRWADHHHKVLAKINTEGAATLTKINTEIAAARAARSESERVLSVMGALSPQREAAFRADIVRQDDKIASFISSLERETTRIAAVVKERAAKVTATENTALAIGNQYIEKVNARLSPIEKLEQAAEANVATLIERTRIIEQEGFERNGEKVRSIIEQEADLSKREANITELRTLRSSDALRVDAITLKHLDGVIAEEEHAAAAAREMIHQFRDHSAHRQRELQVLVEKQTRRKKPYLEKIAFFADAAKVIEQRRTQSVQSNNTLTTSEAAVGTPPEVVVDTTIESPGETPELAVALSNETFDSADTDDDTEVLPENNESVDAIRTIGQFIKSWNSYVQSGTDAAISVPDRDRNIFTIDEKSFIDDARTSGFYSEATIAPNEMASHILGRLKRQIRASRSFRGAVELDEKAAAAVNRYFASLENT